MPGDDFEFDEATRELIDQLKQAEESLQDAHPFEAMLMKHMQIIYEQQARQDDLIKQLLGLARKNTEASTQIVEYLKGTPLEGTP